MSETGGPGGPDHDLGGDIGAASDAAGGVGEGTRLPGQPAEPPARRDEDPEPEYLSIDPEGPGGGTVGRGADGEAEALRELKAKGGM